MKELEATFLEVEVANLEKKLLSLGAKKLWDQTFDELIFDKPDRSWNPIQKRIRIRRGKSKIQVSYKETTSESIDGTEEVELTVDDFDTARLFLEKLGFVVVRQQQKRRIHYELDGVSCDIDFWPRVPAYLEIEADSEKKVRRTAEELGFDWKKAVFLDAKEIYQQIYGVKNIDYMKFLTFEKYE